jgi:hypothetical protein
MILERGAGYAMIYVSSHCDLIDCLQLQWLFFPSFLVASESMVWTPLILSAISSYVPLNGHHQV